MLQHRKTYSMGVVTSKCARFVLDILDAFAAVHWYQWYPWLIFLHLSLSTPSSLQATQCLRTMPALEHKCDNIRLSK